LGMYVCMRLVLVGHDAINGVALVSLGAILFT
jgi:hypothetical protein